MKPRTSFPLIALAIALSVAAGCSGAGFGRSTRKTVYPEPRTTVTPATTTTTVLPGSVSSAVPAQAAPGKAIPGPTVDVPMLEPSLGDPSR